MSFLRGAIGCVVLIAQAAMMVHARFDERRYFCWAPFDALNRYHISRIDVNGTALTDEQIRSRYRLPPAALDQRAIRHVQDILVQVESTYHPRDDTQIEVHYRTNSGPLRVWRYPP